MVGKKTVMEIEEHTLAGSGSRILLISFFALEENHGGQVNSALNICHSKKQTLQSSTFEDKVVKCRVPLIKHAEEIILRLLF